MGIKNQLKQDFNSDQEHAEFLFEYNSFFMYSLLLRNSFIEVQILL